VGIDEAPHVVRPFGGRFQSARPPLRFVDVTGVVVHKEHVEVRRAEVASIGV
jgi:hypothetical protein